MDDSKAGYQATPSATLEQQMMDACAPKNEREWWAFVEIGRLRAEVASLTAQLQSGESFHAVAVRQRDAAWGEVEALRADAERLDCGQIMIDTRDEFGEPKQVWHTGMNLRAAIDAARAAQGER